MHESKHEMNACSIPATIKAMLRIEDATSSRDIDELLARYLRVRGSSSTEGLEHELAAVFAGGVERAAHVIAGLEALRHTSSPVVHSAHAQRETYEAGIPHVRMRPWRGDRRARRTLHCSIKNERFHEAVI